MVPTPSPTHPDLDDEQAYLDQAYAHLGAMRARAKRASEITESASNAVDSAIAQAHLKHRYRSLDTDVGGLAFGRLDDEDGDTWYVGRRHVEDERSNPVVVDWRAPVSTPFYRATAADPMDLRRRRRFVMTGRTVDDLFDALDASEGELELARADLAQAREVVGAQLERRSHHRLAIVLDHAEKVVGADEVDLTRLERLDRGLVGAAADDRADSENLTRVRRPENQIPSLGRRGGQLHATGAEHIHTSRLFTFHVEERALRVKRGKLADPCKCLGRHAAEAALRFHRAGRALVNLDVVRVGHLLPPRSVPFATIPSVGYHTPGHHALQGGQADMGGRDRPTFSGGASVCSVPLW